MGGAASTNATHPEVVTLVATVPAHRMQISLNTEVALRLGPGPDTALGPMLALCSTLPLGACPGALTERGCGAAGSDAALGPNSAHGPTPARASGKNAQNNHTTPTPHSPSAGVLARQTNRKAVGVV